MKTSVILSCGRKWIESFKTLESWVWFPVIAECVFPHIDTRHDWCKDTKWEVRVLLLSGAVREQTSRQQEQTSGWEWETRVILTRRIAESLLFSGSRFKDFWTMGIDETKQPFHIGYSIKTLFFKFLSTCRESYNQYLVIKRLYIDIWSKYNLKIEF